MIISRKLLVLSTIIFSTLIFLSFLIYIFFILFSLGELKTVENVINKQLKNNSCIYGTQTYENFKRYKILLNNKINPDIAVIGSSRVMQIRKNMFDQSKTFVNLGGAVGHINDFEILRKVLNYNDLEYLLIGIDPWFFTENWAPKTSILEDEIKFNDFDIKRSIFSNFLNFENQNNKQRNTNLSKFYINAFNDIRAMDWSRVSESHFFRSFSLFYKGKLNQSMNNKFKLKCAYGISANLQEGFLSDGSRLQRNNFHIDNSKRFQEVLNRIENGEQRYNHNDDINEIAYRIFFEYINFIKSKNINIIIFFSPYPKKILERLENKNFNYINKLKKKLTKDNIYFYDFMDTDKYQFDDCYFMDGDHPSSLTNLRMLQYIGLDNKNFKELLSKDIDNKFELKYDYIKENENIILKNKYHLKEFKIICNAI